MRYNKIEVINHSNFVYIFSRFYLFIISISLNLPRVFNNFPTKLLTMAALIFESVSINQNQTIQNQNKFTISSKH